MNFRKKLIEVALPLPEINDASAYDKMPGIGPHPKGIHHWWARLPLPVARAVLFASVVDDPSCHPEVFPTDEAQEQERERLFAIIRKLMQKQLHTQPDVYAEAQAEMSKYCEGKLPAVLDPFAGGGSIPLEAARLGMTTYAGDLNPVATLLNKYYLELVPRWSNHPPINPEDRVKIAGSSGWRHAAGLAADIRYYGARILEQARERIGHLYPSVEITADMIVDHPSLKPHVGRKLLVIAWIWARTVPSPNPAMRGAAVPLMRSFWLAKNKRTKGIEAWLEPIIDRNARTWRFRVVTGTPTDRDVVRMGTKTGRATFRCLLTEDPIPDRYLKVQGNAGRMGVRMVAIVADVGRGKVYLPASQEHEGVARRAAPGWRPDYELAVDPRNIWCANYALRRFSDLFTPRQLTAIVTFSDLVRENRTLVLRDGLASGLSDAEAAAYADTVTTSLALALDRCADFNNSFCRWNPGNKKVMNLFGRQTIPMMWDFAEANLLGGSVGGWLVCTNYVGDCVETMNTLQKGNACLLDAAASWDSLQNVLISTDPPYYDNIGYAALSDFFYVWLRRTIGDLHPELFGTMLVPKEAELVAAPERFNGDKHRAKEHFEQGFRRAFATLREKMDPRFPLTAYYAFKQDDEENPIDEEGSVKKDRLVDRTTGWETMLIALIETGFQITATWPVRATQKWRQNAMSSNTLASYIVLACRPRPADAAQTDRRSFLAELKRELPPALRLMQQGNIAPVDFAQAAIGPGIAIYSRYSRILEASGRPMCVRSALAVINQTLTEVLTEQEDDVDAETRWAIAWYEQHGFEDGEFGDAEVLSKAKVTSLRSLEEAGMVQSKGGKVRLLSAGEMSKNWDADADSPPVVWKATHHLVRVYWHEKQGEVATSNLLRRLDSRAEPARDLAYRLFALAERKGRSQDAQAYNALVMGWLELVRLARQSRPPQQTTLVEEEEQ